MNIVKKKEALVLFLGDLLVLFVSLYLTITLRYGELPSGKLLLDHLAPFSFLFAISILINFIAGLYEKHTLVLKRKLPGILTRVQIVNTIISIAFFYFIPYFVITPKITLFMYLVISLIIMVAWRMAVAQRSGRRRYKALLMGHGKEIGELHDEINNNNKYGTSFVKWIDTAHMSMKSEEISSFVKTNGISFIVADFSDPKINAIMPVLYKFIFSGVQFADTQEMYEEVFDRVPLSLINDSWFLQNVSSTSSKTSFDLFKRLMDIVLAGVAAVVSLVVYPFVYIAIKLDDKGVLFSYQNRVGQNNNIVRIMKFRTMSIANDDGKWEESTAKKNEVTRVGKFLRMSRIDELPQLWNVVRGDVSLIGPRPEFPDPVATYADQIPYYNMRHLIKPGLSGWAQIYHENHPHHGVDMAETSNKLSYDLYYIKNRSIRLDIKIALQTMKVLFSFVGR